MVYMVFLVILFLVWAKMLIVLALVFLIVCLGKLIPLTMIKLANELYNTTRWAESIVPINKGDEYFYHASYHGQPGSSCIDSREFVYNEQLISKMLLRGSSKGDHPYVINCDLNINPYSSPAINAAIKAGMWIDVSQRFGILDPDGNVKPSFNRTGVFDGMNGSGITRIDIVLVNKAANFMLIDAQYMYEWAVADHVPHKLTFSCERYHDCMRAWCIPASIDVDMATPLNDVQSDNVFNHVMHERWEPLIEGLQRGDIDFVHGIWCDAVVDYLLAITNKKPRHAPSRFWQ